MNKTVKKIMAEELTDKNPSVVTVEQQPLTPEDALKAKKKGSLFGDPIFIVE